MEIQLAYRGENLTLELSDKFHVDSFAPVKVNRLIDFADFETSFADCTRSQGLLNSDRILVIVNDAYRHTPTSTVLGWLQKYQHDILDRCHFLIATGTHDAPTNEHLHKIFGEFYPQVNDRISSHDSRDGKSMAKVSVDRFGQEVWINRMVFEFPQILIIGSVEPHYFAGFAGGRKALFPGLADFATVERNHNLANSLEAAPLKLKGNPVAEHLGELLQFLPPLSVLSIQLVCDVSGSISGLFIGDVQDSFSQAAEAAELIYAHRAVSPYDVVIAELLPPLDNNLYQSQKAFENCQQAVADGGSLIVFSACEEGIGSQHFWNLADKWDKSNNRPGDGRLSFGSHKLSRVLSMSKRINTLLHSTLDDDIVRHVFYEPLQDVTAFLDKLVVNKTDLKLAIVHDAGHTVLKT